MLAVSFRLIKLLVQPLGPPLNTPTEKCRAKAAEQDETASESVERLMLGREEVGREPVGALAHTIRNRDEGCLLTTWSRNQRRLPRELQVQTVVGTADQQACTEVASADVRSRDQDGRADCGSEDRDNDVVA